MHQLHLELKRELDAEFYFQQQLQDSHTIAEVRLTELDNMRGGLERALLDIQNSADIFGNMGHGRIRKPEPDVEIVVGAIR